MGVVDKAGQTMASTKKAADDLQKAIADARKTIQAATQVLQKRAWEGDNPHPADEPAPGERSRTLVSNLRRMACFFIAIARLKLDQGQALRQSEQEAAEIGDPVTTMFTVNLLRVLFVTFCVMIGGTVSSELQGTRFPVCFLGLPFAFDRVDRPSP